MQDHLRHVIHLALAHYQAIVINETTVLSVCLSVRLLESECHVYASTPLSVIVMYS